MTNVDITSTMALSEITIRPALLKELTTLYEFEQGIVSWERPYDETLKKGHINYYDIKAMIESNDTEVIVALDGEIVVGSGYVSVKSAKPYLDHEK